jgi:nucleotide-binding universal stress UspA family protein
MNRIGELLSGVARTLLGSVAEAVLRGFDKPVFVVRSAGT